MRVGRAILVVVFCAAVAAAQNASMAAPIRAVKSSHVRERVLASNQERMVWETAQTWLTPDVPQLPDPAEHHAIHIDSTNQPPLTAPKLRREWLTPSDEDSKLISEK